MNILCLMGLCPKEFEETMFAQTLAGVQTAANKFQWAIINGLSEQNEHPFKILNSLYIGSYPKRYRKLKIPSFPFSHTEGADDYNVGFVNLTVYKTFSKYIGLKEKLDQWVKETNGEEQVILAYAMTSPFVELLGYIKKKYPQVVCCLVVPDLPEYMNVSSRERKIYRYMKDVQAKHFKKNLKDVDCYVLLTDYMKEWFDWDVQYTVIEGIASIQPPNPEDMPSFVEKKILYAGMIEKKYGVTALAEAFTQIHAPDWTLELFGSGSALPEIEEMSRKDPRIVLRGMVPNDVVVKEQRKAALLVNPRNDQQEFTKYSFPSKVIEYMSSGTPMIGYKLSGMPDEYVPHFIQIPQTQTGMKDTLEKAMALSPEERKQIGSSAREFILHEKNAGKQCEKILALLQSCFSAKEKSMK